jgi:CheY-like chemotaxis protein
MHSRPTVLCVDDFKPGLLIRKVFLEQFGFEVLIASNGIEAIELVRVQKIDAVVMDYSMPGMDGEELAIRIRQISQDIPLLLLSGFAREIPVGLRKSVNFYLTKGDAPGLLVSALNHMTSTSTEQRRTQKKNVVSIDHAGLRSKRKSV